MSGQRGKAGSWLYGLDRDRRIINVGLNILDVNGKLSEKPCIHNENYTNY